MPRVGSDDATVHAPEFRVLGPLEVRRGAEVLALGGPKQRAVLAILVTHANRVVSVDRLIDGLWGDAAPQRALGTLQAYISNLRRVLEPTRPAGAPALVLVSEAPGYVLRVPRETVDALRFEDLADEGRQRLDADDFLAADELLCDALELWRGGALLDFVYEPFAAARIAALESRKFDALEDLFDARLALGRHAEIVPELETATSEEPLRERLRAQFMLALYRSGRQADALRTYEELRAVLADDLGVDPSEPVRTLHERILRHDPSLTEIERPTRPSRGAGLAALEPPEPGRALIGRDPELAVLRRALRRAVAGSGGIVLIEGEAGIGKSRLAEEVMQTASDEAFVTLRGYNDEDEASPAHSSWAQIVRQLRILQPAIVARALSAGTLRALGLSPVSSDARSSADAEAVPSRVAEDLCDVLIAVAQRQPVVIVQEDIQWADGATLAVLKVAARRIASQHVVIVATCRTGERRESAPLADTLGAVVRLPNFERVVLRGLTAADIRDLAKAATGVVPSARVAEAIHARTDGNAFFVTELVALLASERRLPIDDPTEVAASGVPGGVRDVVRRRVGRLPDDAQHLLSAAAVIGHEFDVGVAFEAAELAGDRALDAAEAALVSRIVEQLADPGGTYAFSHALVRDTLLEDLGALPRARLHGRVADALVRRHGDDGDHIGDVAWHLWRSLPTRDREEVVPYLARAGELALARADHEGAGALLTRAVDTLHALPPAIERDELELLLQYELALVHGRLFGTRSAEARESVERVQELGRRLKRPAEIAHALWYSFQDETLRGDGKRASDVAKRMLAEAERFGDPVALAFAFSSLGLAALERGDLAEALGLLQTGVRRWSEPADADRGSLRPSSVFDPRAYRPDVMCLSYEAIVAWLLDDAQGSDEALGEAFASSPGGTGGHAYPLALAMYCRTWRDYLRRDASAVARSGEEAAAFARSRGLSVLASASSILAGWGIAMTRDVGAGLEVMQAGLTGASGAVGPIRRPLYLCALGEVLWQNGELSSAADALDEAVKAAEAGSNRYILPELYRLRATIAVDDAQVASALRAAVAEARRQRSVVLEARAAGDLYAATGMAKS